MVAVLYLLRRESQGLPLKERTLNLTIFGLIFFKGLFTGYDFLLPPLGMIATALLFYAFKDRWTFSQAARRLFLAAALSISGVLLSFLVVAAQVGAVTGHFSDGLLHLANTIGRRTVGETLDPAQSGVFASGGAAGLGYVLNVLMSKSAIMVGIKYSHLILFFAGVSILCLFLLWIRRGKVDGANVSYALLGATWISILSPLSWVVAFKAHAFFHTHTTSIIWHMPFAFFGYAVLGHLLSLFIGRRDRLA
jgi:hypothetical protein